MKIALTGASGHIGQTLIKLLLQQNHEVRILVHRVKPQQVKGNVEVFQGDVLDKISLYPFLDGCDALIHASGKIGLGYRFEQAVYDVNVVGTQNILEVAYELKIKKVVHFSSIHIFDQKPYHLPLDETRRFVSNQSVFYDQTKRDAHLFALKMAEKGMNISIVCPTAVLGPNDTLPSKLGKAIVDIYKGNIPAVVKGGFDFVDVRDVAQGTLVALEKGKRGETYILGGNYHSIKEFAALVLKEKNSKKNLPELPLWTAYLGLPFVQFYSKISKNPPLYDKVYLDILQDGNRQILSNNAKLNLNYSPRPLAETIHDTVEFFFPGKKRE